MFLCSVLSSTHRFYFLCSSCQVRFLRVGEIKSVKTLVASILICEQYLLAHIFLKLLLMKPRGRKFNWNLEAPVLSPMTVAR